MYSSTDKFWQEMVFLRDVRWLFAECFEISFSPVYFDSTNNPTFPVKTNYSSLIHESHFLSSANAAWPHFNPAKMFINELFPAPEGPRMAESWPDLKNPYIWCKICLAFFPEKYLKKNKILFQLNRLLFEEAVNLQRGFCQFIRFYLRRRYSSDREKWHPMTCALDFFEFRWPPNSIHSTRQHSFLWAEEPNIYK